MGGKLGLDDVKKVDGFFLDSNGKFQWVEFLIWLVFFDRIYWLVNLW